MHTSSEKLTAVLVLAEMSHPECTLVAVAVQVMPVVEVTPLITVGLTVLS